MSIPGGCCSCDIPQLHYWLEKPWHQRQADYKEWVSHFNVILTPIKLFLQFTRQCGVYHRVIAKKGIFQSSSQNKLSLLRIQLDDSYDCYPRISGLKNRFAIHFTNFNSPSLSAPDIDFFPSYMPLIRRIKLCLQ